MAYPTQLWRHDTDWATNWATEDPMQSCICWQDLFAFTGKCMGLWTGSNPRLFYRSYIQCLCHWPSYVGRTQPMVSFLIPGREVSVINWNAPLTGLGHNQVSRINFLTTHRNAMHPAIQTLRVVIMERQETINGTPIECCSLRGLVRSMLP